MMYHIAINILQLPICHNSRVYLHSKYYRYYCIFFVLRNNWYISLNYGINLFELFCVFLLLNCEKS